MRVSQLAKELEKESKDIISILEKSGIEGKKAQSGLETGEEELVRKALVPAAESQAANPATKKKKIIFVSNPQNSKMSGQPQRSATGGMDRRPAAPRGEMQPSPSTSAKSVKEAFAAALQTNKEEAPKTEVKAAAMESVIQENKREAVQEMLQQKQKTENKPESRTENRPESRPQGDRPSSNYQGNNYQGNRPQGDRPNSNYQGNNYQGNRPQGDRPNSNYQGNNYQGNNYQGNRPQGDRPNSNYQGNNYQGNRPQGDRPNSNYQGNNYQGNRPQGDRPNSNYQGNNYQGNRPQGDRPNSNYQGNNYQGNRPQGDRPNNNYQGNRPQGGYQPRTQEGGAGRDFRSNPGYNQGFNRPAGDRPAGNRPYNNASAGGNRPYNNNGRSQNGNGGENNRFSKPQGKSGFGSDTPIMQPEKRRDEAKRKLGQEKDSRSRKDKIYEEDMTTAQKAGRFIKPEKKVEVVEEIKVITIPDILTIKDLADKMKIQPSAIVKKLFLQGQIVTVNQEISYESAEEIAIEYEIMCEREVKVDVIEELLKEEEENPEDMTPRPPVICVMGHVDHGKTSLLDAIRKTNVTDREAGGITQHIGAYTVQAKGQKITFLDTPGHEAFTAMRMRGANATDIAILVVAADDGVMPQTVEAINHAKAAGIEIIVAVNKVDKPNANIDRVKQELAEHELIPEDWGGTTVFAPVSAKTGEGIEQLLEMILLTAEILELKANAKREARGLVIEAQLDKGRGSVATILVQKGTLHVGDFIAAGSCHGKVRALLDDKGRRVKEAGPSTPVEILGLNDVPNAGDVFVAPSNDREAKQFAETFISQGREKMLEDTKAKMSLDDLFTQIQAGNLKELNLIVKADVQGSVEAVKQSLLKLSNEEVVVKIIHSGVGAVNESDVILASASQAIIIAFNVRPDVTAKTTAEREGVDLRQYKVIYQAIEDIEAAMKGMLDPVYEEKVIAHAEVRQIFKASAIGNIAGSYVLDGTFQRGCKVRISRQGEQIFEGNLESLKRFKDDVKEVKTGFECGLVFEGFDQMQELDIVEAYIMVEVPR